MVAATVAFRLRQPCGHQGGGRLGRDLHRRLEELKAIRDAYERGILDGLPGSRGHGSVAIKAEIDEVLAMIARRLEELARC